jgi:alkanesulfonate monooxygenase SsuD/methylene tetrahydromethanopterin reductase-like flavin-dependent oxidoreductase (luciferase family)
MDRFLTAGGGESLSARMRFRKPRLRDGKLRFGIFWPYSQTTMPSEMLAQRNPDVMDLDNHMRLAQSVEQAGFDMILVADGYAVPSTRAHEIMFQDPSTHAVIWTVPLIMATRRIGIVSTIHTTFFHPVQIARFGSHLAHLSGGRWGWNIVAGHRIGEARLFGHDQLLDHDVRYRQAEETLQVALKIWENPSGIDHDGEMFKVHGRMRGPFPPERPVLVNAASSATGRAFATRHCDFLFATVSDEAGIVTIADDLRARAAEAGRAPLPILITALVMVRPGAGAARREYDEIIASLDPVVQGALSEARGRITQGGKMTDFPVILGTEAEVAEQIIALYRNTGVGGLMLRLIYWTPQEIATLLPVLERLERAGVWVPPERRGHSW